MARKKRTSIYATAIKEVNVSDLMWGFIEESHDPDWNFELHSNWADLINVKYKDLDFCNIDFITGSATYWCGILTLEPFHTLGQTVGSEEDILNLIKNEHIKMVQENGDYILRFSNSTTSPLYRFFNQHKECGYGGNVTYSVNGLLSKIEKYLKNELENNLSTYGEWIPYEEAEDDIA